MWFNLLTAVWFAVAVRTPNETPNQFDYELSTGAKTEAQYYKSNMKFLWERENGNFYTGRIHSNDLMTKFQISYLDD